MASRRHCVLILRNPAKPGVSKDEEAQRLRHMVRDGAARLLTMRGRVGSLLKRRSHHQEQTALTTRKP
ncbi:hypothetical protein DY468_15780 [Rhodopseudomonas sp. BR0M22]|nr:hypothetical protein [Rhodopseudomonas sp. BR0M22]